MKRRMAMLAAVAAVSGIVTMFSPSSPAQAAVHAVCAGTGNANLDNTLFYPVNSTTTGIPLSPRSANFTFHLGEDGNVGVCLTGTTPTVGGPSATGTVHGWCGLSVGSGTVTGAGSTFSWIGIGSFLLVTGEVSGLVNASPNLLGGDSCLTNGADDFIVTGVAVQKSCTLGTPISVTATVPPVPPVTHAGFTGSVHVCIP
jgi:hypothetical protein